MQLSILVPVYNVEKFLDRCLKSLIGLRLKEYEIILVDDGSTDHSGEICDVWADRYKYVKIIHQKNKGLVSARTVAMKEAKGKYIAFVDSDDWVDKELLPCLTEDLEKIPDVDIAVGSIVRNVENNVDLPHMSRKSGIMTREQAVRAMVKKDGMHWYLWGKVFRHNLFSDFDVEEKVTVFEDLDRIWPIVTKSEGVYFDNRCAYHYFVNTEGLTKKRCDLNIESWRVFKRVLLSEYGKHVKQEMVNFYVQIFLRHTLEMCFVNATLYQREIELYIYELKDTLHKVDGIQNIIPQNDFDNVTRDYRSCVEYYNHIFENIKTLLENARKKYSTMYVYGIGVIAQYVATIMKSLGIYPDGYVVSDGQPKTDKFMEINVFYFSELRTKADMSFVLALAGNAEIKVKEILEMWSTDAHKKIAIYSSGFPAMTF